MSFRAFATLLCGCFIVLAAATSTVSAQHFTCNFNQKTQTCGGTCPKGQACTRQPDSKDCKCQEPISNKCKFNDKTSICGGTCPEGQACTLLPGTKACECKPPPSCGYNEKTKTCGGACPKGKACKPGPVKTKCGCY
jgi:hypothetical protein